MTRRNVTLAALLAVAGAGGALLALSFRGGPGRMAVEDSRPAVQGDSAGEPSADRRSAPGRRAVLEQGEAPQAAERADAVPGAYLRVVDPGGAPAAGFALAASFALGAREGGTERLVPKAHPLRSDDEGLVDLAPALEARPGTVLVVLGCPGEPEVLLVPAILSRGLLGASPAEAPRVVRTRRAVGPVRGLVVDAASGAPIPDHFLRLVTWMDALEPEVAPGTEVASLDALRVRHRVGGRSVEWVTTDEGGRFISRIELPDARIHFATYEKDSVEGEHRIGLDGRGGEIRLAVQAGPIVLLDFDPPDGLAASDFIAAVRREGNEHPVWMPELASPLDPHQGQRLAGGHAAAVRAGSPPWVRGPIWEQPLPSYFVLESRDRRHFGSALVEDLARHATRPLRVELATRGVLELHVEWPADVPSGGGLSSLLVTLTRLDELAADPGAKPVLSKWVARAGDERTTIERLAGFAPGRHALVAGATAAPWLEVQPVPVELEVDLPRADPLRLPVSLLPLRPTYRVEGLVRTASGRSLDGRDGRPKLNLYGSTYIPSVLWSEGTARFVAEDVPEGSLRLQIGWSSGWFPSQPEELVFEVPGPPIEVLVQDDLPAEEVIVRVIEPLEPGWVKLYAGAYPGGVRMSKRFEPDKLATLPDGRRAFQVTSGPIPAGTEVLRVFLSVEGHERLWLSDRDVPRADEEGRRVVELFPRPGWSARVVVVTAGQTEEDLPPRPGIVLAFDGVETPASDEGGLLIHRAPAEPQRLEVFTPGWELVDRSSYFGRGSVFAASGRFTLDDGELTVLVHPSER